MIRRLVCLMPLLLVSCATPQPKSEVSVSTGAPLPIYRAQPKYPLAAAHIEGCVVVSFVILPDGHADQFQVIQSEPKGVFDQATLTALLDWKFAPPPRPGRYAQEISYKVKGGMPVEHDCTIPSFEALNPGAKP